MDGRPQALDRPHPVPAARILIVLHDFSGGGSERVAIRLANAWGRAGREVSILCGDEGGPARALVEEGVRVMPLDPPIGRGPFSRLRLGRALARPVAGIAPDVLFAPGNFHLPVLAALATGWRGPRPVIACKISNPLERAGRGALRQRLFARSVQAMTRCVDLLVAMSPALAQEATRVLRRRDIDVVAEPTLDDAAPSPDACLPASVQGAAAGDAVPSWLRADTPAAMPEPGVAYPPSMVRPLIASGRMAGGVAPPSDAGQSIAPAPGDAHRPPAIVCIGRLAPQKRFDLAIAAFALLPDRSATLALVGDGPEGPALAAQAARLGVADRVRFAGHVADVAGELARADLLLSTSAYEGYPAVLVEALAAGVPVVATDCSPAISEIMAHPSFGQVAAADPRALADAVAAQLARPRPDPAAVARLADRHRIGPAAAAWLALFDRAVAGRG